MIKYLEKKPGFFEIGETYLKLNLEFTEDNKKLLTDIYSYILKEISRELLKERKVKISIEFDEGSLKTKIKIWGLIATIYIGIGNYGSFRQGIREIINDVRNLSEYVIHYSQNEQPIGQKIIRSERRRGFSGRIYNIYDRIDKLERNLNNLSQNEIRNELTSIKQEISNIGVLLPEEINQQFLEELPNNYRDNLPEPNERKVRYLISRYALKPEDKIEFIE
ncbi:hypothetical protein ACSSWA_06290 [Melioribacter sp. Ez-97]|uniref:hypothetical protein n=1 Tax=Melioribacter sp. Ez-97 TaxID=3423434 RepID=UPI003ED86FA4